jgi:hypothetical protein
MSGTSCPPYLATRLPGCGLGYGNRLRRIRVGRAWPAISITSPMSRAGMARQVEGVGGWKRWAVPTLPGYLAALTRATRSPAVPGRQAVASERA